MDLRTAEMDKLKREGKTYEEIAQQFGISRQRVFQILGKMDKRYFKPISKKCVFYPGLRNWMNENRISFTELCRRVYGKYHTMQYGYLWQYTSAQHPMKIGLIIKLINITGLTFEQLFLEGVENGNTNNG